jgi:hypothetical protein
LRQQVSTVWFGLSVSRQTEIRRVEPALLVSDPSANATGRLVNGAFSLIEPLQARASGAAGLGSAALAFRQHRGTTQALRTGAYSRTLAFTLSTTTP